MGKQNSSFINNIKYVNVNSAELNNLGKSNGGIVGEYVESVNGMSGNVQLDAVDVGAMPLLKAIEGMVVSNAEKIIAYNAFSGQEFLTGVEARNAKYAYLSGAFQGCGGLKEIRGFDKVTEGYFENAFRSCGNLEYIEDGAFSRVEKYNGNTNKLFYYTFKSCYVLKRIPSNIFAGVKKLGVNTFGYTFHWATDLEEIPSGLFDNIVDDGEEHTYAFQAFCVNTKITSIPEGLFDNLIWGQSHLFDTAFAANHNLTTVPKYLFKNIVGEDTTQGKHSNSTFYDVFTGCENLEGELEFSSLVDIGSSCFNTAFKGTKISALYFPAVKSTSFYGGSNAFSNMLSGVNGCVVHFPSNVQSVIGNYSSVTNGFGGTNTTVLFDLPATDENESPGGSGGSGDIGYEDE